MTNTINREHFEAWLFSQPDERTFEYIYGSYDSNPGCLLCNFLRETTNINKFEVGRIIVSMNGTNYPLPNWFINLLSKQWLKEHEFYSRNITFKEVKEHYLLLFPNAVVGSNDSPAIAENLSFNSTALETKSIQAQS